MEPSIRTLLILVLLIPNSNLQSDANLQAAGPRIIQTDRGKYELYEFPNLPEGDIELSSDSKYLVLNRDQQVTCFELPDLERPVGGLAIKQPGNWKIVGEKMIVAVPGGWKGHALPSLKEDQTIPLPPIVAQKAPFGNLELIPQSVPEGWLLHGLLFSPDTTKVIGTMRGFRKGKWVDLSDQLRLDYSPSQIPITIRFNQRIPYIPGVTDCIEFTPEGPHLLGFDRLLYATLPGDSWQYYRCGEGWFSAQVSRRDYPGKPDHVLIKVLSLEAPKPTRQFGLFRLTQPTLLLDSQASFVHATTEGDKADDLQIVTWPRIEAGTLKMPDRDRELPNNQEPIHWLYDNWSEFHEKRSEPNSLDELRQGLQKFIDQAKVEYELAVGKPPTEVPIPIQVGIKQGERRHEYFVWTEISENELLCSFGTDFLNLLVEKEYNGKRLAYERKAQEKNDANRTANNQQVLVARENKIAQAKVDQVATRYFLIISSCVSLLIGVGCVIALFVLSHRLGNMSVLLCALLLPTQLYAQSNRNTKADDEPKTKNSKAQNKNNKDIDKENKNKTPSKNSPSKSSNNKFKKSKIPGIGVADTWTIERGEDIVRQIRSLPLEGSNHQLRVGYHSGRALLRYESEKGKPMLATLDLNQASAIVQVDYPSQWDWGTTTVCNQYAACFSDNKLMVLDTNTCKIIKDIAAPRLGKLVILFDKALWLEPDLWFALPTLKPVLQHPIVDPGARTRWLTGYNAPPCMLDDKLCIIEGVEFDANLRETGKFYGHAQNLDPAFWSKPFRLDVQYSKLPVDGPSKDAPKVWNLNGKLEELGGPSVKVPERSWLIAAAPESFQIGNDTEPLVNGCRFSVYKDGVWCLRDNWLIVVQPQDAYKSDGWAEVIFPTPFLETESKAVEVPFKVSGGRPWRPQVQPPLRFFNNYLELSRNPRKLSAFAILDTLDNQKIEPVALSFEMPTANSLPLGIIVRPDRQVITGKCMGNCILEQVIMWADAPPKASWDELAKAYRQQCAHWIKFAPEELRNREDLFPFEIALSDFHSPRQDGCWASVVLFAPEKQFSQLHGSLYKRETAIKNLSLMSAEELPPQIAQFEKRDRNVSVPASKEFDPPPEPDPRNAQPASPPVVPNFNPTPRPYLGLLIQVVAMPLTIALRGLYLLAAVWSINLKFQRKSDKITFPGSWVGIILTASAWVTLEFALNNGFAFIAFYLTGLNFVIKLVVFCFSLMISLAVILGLINILSDPDNEHMNVVALRAFGCVAIASVPSLPFVLMM